MTTAKHKKSERIKGITVRHTTEGKRPLVIASCPKCDHEEKATDRGEDSANSVAAKIDAHILLVHARHAAE